MRALRILLFAAGALLLVLLVQRVGTDSITSALSRISPWQFALIALLHTANLVVDALAWRFTLSREWAATPLHRLVLARCAGDAVNVLAAVAAVGGEAVKAWLLRREIPYEGSVPSLILAKTSELFAQVLLFLLAMLLAWSAGNVDSSLLVAMGYLFLGETICAGGLFLVQVAGVIDGAGRLLDRLGVKNFPAARLGQALRRFYREDWRRFLASIGFHFIGWLLGAVEALLILYCLGLTASVVMATVLEALWSAVRFATFFVPASLGTLEGANAAAFAAFGFGAGAGLAFTLIRRARQAVWIAIGAVVLVLMSPTRLMAAERKNAVAPGATESRATRQAT